MRYNVRMRMIHKTYKVRVKCGRATHRNVDTALELTRRLYNAALADRRERWRLGRQRVTKFQQNKMLTELRREMPEFAEFSVSMMREPLDRLDKAYAAFFRRAKAGETPGYPRFKGPRWWKSVGPLDLNASMIKRVGEGRYDIRLKGIGRMRLRLECDLPDSDALVKLRVKREGRKIWACLTYKIAVEDAPEIEADPVVVGIDMGVSERATLSDGTWIKRVRIDKRRKKRLQRRLSRAKKGSKSRRRKRADYARECNKAALRQLQATHRHTTEIVRKYDFIVFEDLQIPNMTKSANGTADKPGKNVAQKRGLNREILEQGWGLFRSQLTYKAEWAGKTTKAIKPHYTSQICSKCGVKDGDQRKGKRYDCGRCGLSMDADLNAAINILRRGMDSVAGRVGTGSREGSGAASAAVCELTALVGAGADDD